MAEDQQNGASDRNRNRRAHVSDQFDSEQALRRIQTAGSINISPELFEKLYLSPPNRVKGDLRKTFGNPTPIGLIGYLMALTPLSMILMGWRGSSGLGESGIGSYYYFGGMLMTLSGVLEFLLGNTFPSVVFTVFGAFWLTFGTLLTPAYNATAAYAGPGDPTGAHSPVFEASFGFFQLAMAMVCLVFLICALRTNVVFVGIFLFLFLTFCCLAGAYWQGSNGDAVLDSQLTVAGGFMGLAACLFGWWIFLAQMLQSVDFPIQLPVGDVSHLFKGYSEREALKSTKYDPV